MSTTIRRLRILETAFGPPLIPRPNKRLNMAVLSDAEIDFMADLSERLKHTGTYHDVTDAELEEAERILMLAGAA